jgi:hypothetical protein
MFARIFLAHPRSVNEDFFEHMFFALHVVASLLYAAGAVLIHAFVPSLFENTASGIISRLHTRIQRKDVPTHE